MHATPATHRMLAGAKARAILTYAATGVLLALAILLAGDEIERHIDGIEAWIAALRPWSILAFVLLFVVATSLLLPDTLLAIMAGARFGLRWGIVAVLAGSLLAAMLQYALSHRLLRDRIERALEARPSLAAIQRAVRGNEVRLRALLRLTPLNPATVSYVLGAAGVRFRGFLLTCLALVPNLVLELYFGYPASTSPESRGAGRAPCTPTTSRSSPASSSPSS